MSSSATAPKDGQDGIMNTPGIEPDATSMTFLWPRYSASPMKALPVPYVKE